MCRWLLRLAAGALLVGFPAAMLTERAEACDCDWVPLFEAMDDSDAVFAGTLVAGGEGDGAEFEVSRVWKGDVEATTLVYFDGGGTSCEMWLDEGEEYLVFAYRNYPNEPLVTGFCTRTVELKHAQQTVEALGEGRPPGTGPVVPTARETRRPSPPCQCATASLLEAVDDADAVFAGQVTPNSWGQWVEIRVTSVWKGNVDETTDIYIQGRYTDCFMHLQEGEEYLIFAYQYYAVDPLATHRCTRTTTLENAQGDLAVLGQGHPPGTGAVTFTPPEPQPPIPGATGTGLAPDRCVSTGLSLGLPVVGAVALAVLAYVTLRRRRMGTR